MAFMAPATPQRQMPGAFAVTPAPARAPAPQFGRAPSQSGSMSSMSRPAFATRESQTGTTGMNGATGSLRQSGTSAPSTLANQELRPIERAAKAINENLMMEQRFPLMEDYITQGISSHYDVPPTASSPWAPFQKTKVFEIPERVFEEYNKAEVSTGMGLFAELHHAWCTVDNNIYLWDYTNPNAELQGYAGQQHRITAVKLARPRPGIFVNTITHILVVATVSEIHLIGLATQKSAAGIVSLSLYETGMQATVKGLNVNCLVGSSKTGRIFFGTTTNNDVWEFTYQQEDKWFSNKCAKINHTQSSVTAIGSIFSASSLTALVSKQPDQERIEMMVMDDTRDLLYVLSSKSTIRVFNMSGPEKLDLLLTKTWRDILHHVTYYAANDLFQQNAKIISIDPIPASESNRLYLMAVTSTGVRIFLSASSGYGPSSKPSSMMVHHLRFPPPPEGSSRPPQAPSNDASRYQANTTTTDSTSKSLVPTDLARRFSPGYCFTFVAKPPGYSTLFLSAPDAGRIARTSSGAPARYLETGQWIPLGAVPLDMGLTTPAFSASREPAGFGNELAVQFDKPASEFAVLTNSGIQTFRRRRLVDLLASALRDSNSDDAFGELVSKFSNFYGLPETCAAAVAVACGQAMDMTAESRLTTVNDPTVIEQARRLFVDRGGKPSYDADNLAGGSDFDKVQLSSRCRGLALYMSRVVRSVWKAPVVVERVDPKGGLSASPAVALTKLRAVQKDLTNLQDFIDANKNFIEGLAGPAGLSQVTNPNDEKALQVEHQMLHSLVKSIADFIEGIAFVNVLFDEPVDEIILSLPDSTRQQVRELTYERLFVSSTGKQLAKELVKAIVNRSIARGSNVDTVAEALRRRCGSFCSAGDVVIFKAQEQLKKASEAGAETSSGRSLLNDSLALFQKVAADLSPEHLQGAIDAYVHMAFYAGAIRLALSVAEAVDPANRALSWINDGYPEHDTRQDAYFRRKECYDLVTQTIVAVDNVPAQDSEMQRANIGRRKEEAYEEINSSDDEVFQIFLFDWYIAQGWSERLLEISSRHVIAYLDRKSNDDIAHADLLWRYYTHHGRFFEAAQVQLRLAKSDFELPLSVRIEYLSRAKANAIARVSSIQDFGRARQTRQEVLREISDLLDIAGIQEDLIQRLDGDTRLTDTKRPAVVAELNGRILPLDDVYNGYVEQAGYYDLCLVIYQVADYRNSADIEATWQNLVNQTHGEAEQSNNSQAWEAVADKVRTLGRKLNCSETTFPVPIVLPILLQYLSQNQPEYLGKTWPVDLFLELQIPYETLLAVLESLFYRHLEPNWSGRRHELIARLIVYVARIWMQQTAKGGGVYFGSEENARSVSEILRAVLADQRALPAAEQDVAREIRERVDRIIR